MEKIVEQALLYDFYGELLTDHQKHIYEDFVLNDLSLSEIAEEQGISRQGVHDLIKRCNKILADYEEKLHLVDKFIRTKENINRINQLAKEFESTKQTEKINEIQKISNQILEEF
ncbi:YlxM family DNA-binding protein [Konateibacter massiliensis]|uniref:YlxM family DNA-binding protein n=1 Tax=Konateibacter massiliensis TaxID=2002841 RepID=UPI000C15BE19|nr:putative DNA-binding protein [Konateibacter massiliensis]